MHKGETTWLKLSQHGNGVSIQKKENLTDFFCTLDTRPRLFLLIGETIPTNVFSVSHRSFRGRHGHGEIRLQWEARPQGAARDARELLLARGPVDIPVTVDKDPATSAAVDWLAQDPLNALPAVYSRIFGPLADIVCVSLSDFAGVPGLVGFIAAWLRQAFQSPGSVRPQLVIFTEEPSAGPAWEASWIQSFLSRLKKDTSIPFEKSFSGASVCSWKLHDRLLSRPQVTRLRHALLNVSCDDSSNRAECLPSFSARQLNMLLEEAYKSFVQQREFDYISSSRFPNPVPPQAARHVMSFIRAIPDTRSVREFAIPVIASCFLLNGFPPEMHRFDPRAVYKTLYEPIWKKAAKGAGLAAEVGAILEDKYAELYGSGDIALYRESHRRLMRSFPGRWECIRSDRKCLMCLMEIPENSLPCGHSFCDVDIRLYGKLVGPSTFLIDTCWLCSRMAGITFKLKPRTKGINVLGIDGGGIRGIIPLEILNSMEQRLKPYLPELPVQNLFDLAIGTSSGGLIVLASVFQGVPVAKCRQIFRDLAAKAFRSRFSRTNSVVSRAFELLVSLFRDFKYPSDNIEGALKEQFGGDTTMFDYSPAAARGAKVGVTVTGVPEGEYVITNYNGAGSEEFRRGYRHVLSDGDPCNRIHVWNAGRATSAAPWFFLLHYINNKKYQDGGLWANNPSRVLELEAKSLYTEIATPDITVSLGTGCQAETGPSSPQSPTIPTRPGREEKSPPKQAKKSDWSVKRLLQSFLNSTLLDGEKSYLLSNNGIQQAQNSNRFFRFNVDIPSAVPLLDDVGAMDGLSHLTKQQQIHNPELDRLKDMLLSTLFYLELTAWPVRNRKHVSCWGRILCNIEPGPVLVHLVDALEERSSELVVAERRFPIARASQDDLTTDPFHIAIQIHVQSLSLPFPISLQRLEQKIQRGSEISASPFTINGLLQAQGWKSPFGRKDHGSTGPGGDNTQKRKPTQGPLSRRTRRR